MPYTTPGARAAFQRPCFSLWRVVCHTPGNDLDPSGYFMYHIQKILQSTHADYLCVLHGFQGREKVTIWLGNREGMCLLRGTN